MRKLAQTTLVLACLVSADGALAQAARYVGAWLLDGGAPNRQRAIVISQEGEQLHARFGMMQPEPKLGPAVATLSADGALTIKSNAGTVVVLTVADDRTLVGRFAPATGRESAARAARMSDEMAASLKPTRAPPLAELAPDGSKSTAPLTAASPPAGAGALASEVPTRDQEVHFVHMGGNDCPPCVHWRATELPKLQGSPEFRRIRFSFVTKQIPSAVPPKFFLPDGVKPYKEILDMANGGTAGSPQAAVIVDGKIYDYYWGARSAEEVEAMLRSIRTGSKYPFTRCLQMAPESRRCGIRG